MQLIDKRGALLKITGCIRLRFSIFLLFPRRLACNFQGIVLSLFEFFRFASAFLITGQSRSVKKGKKGVWVMLK